MPLKTIYTCEQHLRIGMSIVELLIQLPSALIALLAGWALLQPILKFTNNMLLSDDAQAGLITFMFTASSVSLFGIGSAFWGVVLGVSVHFVARAAQRVP